jgi:hypothetical protein
MRSVRFSLLLLALAACSGAPAKELRKVTYPPTFEYVSRDDIQTDMHALARNVAELDRLLRPEVGAPEQAEVVRLP